MCIADCFSTRIWNTVNWHRVQNFLFFRTVFDHFTYGFVGIKLIDGVWTGYNGEVPNQDLIPWGWSNPDSYENCASISVRPDYAVGNGSNVVSKKCSGYGKGICEKPICSNINSTTNV